MSTMGPTIIKGEYNDTIRVGPPDRPDTTTAAEREAARRADRVLYFDLIDELRWSAREVEIAERLGLLHADCGVMSSPADPSKGRFAATSQRSISRAKFAERCAEVKLLAKRLK